MVDENENVLAINGNSAKLPGDEFLSYEDKCEGAFQIEIFWEI